MVFSYTHAFSGIFGLQQEKITDPKAIFVQ